MLIQRQRAVHSPSLGLFHHLHKIDITKSWVDKNKLWQKINREEGNFLMLIEFIETFAYGMYRQVMCGVHNTEI
jgi:hypothetical protein